MRTRKKILRSTEEVVAAFGGTLLCSRQWDVTKQAVSGWKKDGIPPGYHLRMEHMLKAAGHTLDVHSLGWV